MRAAKNSLALISFLLVSCSSTAIQLSSSQEALRDVKGVKSLWRHHFKGFVTDLSISRNGSAVLVSSAPNREVESGARQYEVALLDSEGKVAWRFQPEAPVKAQAISDDASQIVISTYDDRLTAYDRAGKMLWSADGTCKPFLLTPLKKIVCYHDDDAEAEIAFDVFSWKGEKLLSYPISNDVLQLKVSEDETHLAIALTQGQVVFFDSNFRSLWQKKVSGEILDLSVSSDADPQIAVLSVAKGKRKITVFDSHGKVRWEATSAAPAVQLESSPEGVLLTYGNSTKGQVVSIFSGVGGPERQLQGKTAVESAYNSDANLPMAVTREFALISAGGGAVEAIDFQGRKAWRVPVTCEESVYLYAQAYASSTGTWVAGTDDGWVSAYRIAPIR